MTHASTPQREPRFDLLKAIAITFVLVWHLHPIYVDDSPVVVWLVRFFEMEVSLTAVPIFLLVSLLLFLPRALDGGPRLLDRLARLASIFFFWSAIQAAIALCVSGWPHGSLEMLRLGGPDLPVIGASVFYYLYDLIVLTLLAIAFVRIPEPARAVTGILVVLASLAWFEWSLLSHHTILYFDLANFVLYVPIAFYQPRLSRQWPWFLVAWGAFVIHDLYLGNQMDCAYGRATVVLGALAITGACFSREVVVGRASRVLASYSLGIFAVHKYWWYLLVTLKGHHSLNVPVGGATVHVAAVLLFVGTLLLTAASVFVLSRTPLRRFVA